MVDSVVGVDCPEGECGGMAVVGCKSLDMYRFQRGKR